MIDRLGKEIADEDSVCYWCHKNKIPMFCPALTDGSIGDMLYFHSYKNPGLVVDLVQDIREINTHAVKASPRKTGCELLPIFGKTCSKPSEAPTTRRCRFRSLRCRASLT